MINRGVIAAPLLSLCLLISHAYGIQRSDAKATHWKAGVSRVVITPEESMWMAGYGNRKHPSEGKLHDLWAKALVLEDAGGNRVILVTADLLGIPREVSNRIRDRLHKNFGLTRAQIMINSSHTHSGPVLQNALYDIYPLDAVQMDAIDRYTHKFEEQIVALVANALEDLEEVSLFSENGVTRFQVNRRNNAESELDQLVELKGPNDFAVPVLKIENEKGHLKAVAFGYACHPTVLNGYEWSGDYAGVAQAELEKSYPGATALFFQGAGADQNPLPRRSVALAQQYGETLAAAVKRVLNEDMRALAPKAFTAYTEIELSLIHLPDKKELHKMANTSSGTQQRWAARLLKRVDRGEPFEVSYPYPLQVWKLGDQMVVALGGELVVDYAIKLKEVFGPEIFVLGYSNDVMAYIPSARILKEGGYEASQSQMVYGLPGKWSPTLETKILNGIISLAQQTGSFTVD